MLELLLYFLIIAPFLMNEKEKRGFLTVIIIAAVILYIGTLFYE